MGKLCRHCGAGLMDTAAFCGACGGKQDEPVFDALSQPAPQATATVPPVSRQPRRSNTVVKVVLGLVGLMCVGGVLAVGAVIYLAHKASDKVRDLSRQVTGKDSPSDGLASLLPKAGQSDPGDDNGIKGDPCRFLSKEDVSHAAGVTIIRAESKDGGCMYVARGDPAEMTSKHMAAMLGRQAASRGDKVTPQQQQMMQQITGAFFKQQENSDKELSAEAARGEVIVLAVGFDSKTARMSMRLNKLAFDRMKGSSPIGSGESSTAETATGDLTGLGDEAYEMGGTMLAVRKGDTMVRFMFNECPCSADAIKPLAEKVVGQL